MESKKCTRCKIEKPLDKFRIHNAKKDGRGSKCLQCDREERKIKHPDYKIEDLLILVDLFIYANGMDEENFMPVKGFETRFWVSDFGRIVSCNHRNGCVNFLKPNIDITHYYTCLLRMKPKKLKIRVHQLEAQHFLNHDPLRTWINHKDGIKLNNHIDNIEYVTPAENVKHAVATGLMDFKGEKHPQAKLTKENVLEMRRLRKQGVVYSEIGTLFGISRRQAGDVVRGVNWGWLK